MQLPEDLENTPFNFTIQVFPDCKAKKNRVSSISGLSWQKKTNSFVSFLGESMARQSAFGFI